LPADPQRHRQGGAAGDPRLLAPRRRRAAPGPAARTPARAVPAGRLRAVARRGERVGGAAGGGVPLPPDAAAGRGRPARRGAVAEGTAAASGPRLNGNWSSASGAVNVSLTSAPGRPRTPTTLEAAMPFAIACPCGKRMRVRDELAGTKVQCPACRQVLLVPKAAPPP